MSGCLGLNIRVHNKYCSAGSIVDRAEKQISQNRQVKNRIGVLRREIVKRKKRPFIPDLLTRVISYHLT